MDRRQNGQRRAHTFRARCGGLLAAAAVLFSTAAANAEPQFSAGLTEGLAMTDLRSSGAPRYALHVGGRFDVLFLRDRPTSMGLGPYVDLATEAFDTFQTGGGLEWLVPTGGTAFILSGGGFARTSSFGWEPGAQATLFWGGRDYNYHSTYAAGLGLFAQGRYGFGDGRQADAILGVQVDLLYLALPAMLLYQAIRH